MMLKVDNEYLDFNETIEVDRKAKLFEEMDKIQGDVSFEFNLYLSSKNTKILNFPFPDSASKSVYRTIDADLFNDEGQLISSGHIKIERKINDTLFCSFFGGNSNWFARLTGNMTDLSLSQYDVEQTYFNIRNSWEETEGVVWPIIDTGGLSTRSHVDFKIEDFTPCIYVKTLMFELFQQSGLKIAGELLDDWVYNNMIMASNGRSKEAIVDRSSFVFKDIPQTIDYTAAQKVTFNDESTYPYFDGSQDNFNISLSRYVADIKMIVNVNGSVRVNSSVGGRLTIRKNGIVIESVLLLSNNISASTTASLDAGDYLELWYVAFPTATEDVEEATFKITPTYLYKSFGNSVVPKWTKQDFVAQITSLFNVIPSYDTYTKTVTFNLFDKLKYKAPIDFSEYVKNIEEDYSEFISDYGQNNNFMYQQTEIQNLKEYNISTFLQYGAGMVSVDNDFLDQSVDVLESDFASPISYINGAFNMSLERIQFVEFGTEDAEITGVSNPGFDIARFAVSEDIFAVNDLIRIYNSTNSVYNGEWLVSAIGAGYIQVSGLNYDTNATADISRLSYEFTTDDSVYIFINIPNYSISKVVPGGILFSLDQTPFSSAAIAYFNLLNTGQKINTDFKQGLSFGEIEDPLFYQRTLLQTYWNVFYRVLNDPVNIKADAYLPWKVHNELDFLRPIIIKTQETSNLYYCSLERGYNNSYTPCQLELIKLP